MSLTLQDRISKVEAYAMVYHRSLRLSQQLIAKNIERSRDEIFRRYLNVQEHLFRTEKTVSDGDALPDDYVMYANMAYQVSGGNYTPIVYIEPEDVAEVNVNPLVKASSGYPCIFFSDQKIMTQPSGLTSVHFVYYAKPSPLFASPLVLSVTDNMPEDTEDAIARGAYERCLQMILTEGDALQYNQQEIQQAADAYASFTKDYYEKQMEGVETR